MRRVQEEVDSVVGDGPIDGDQVGRLELLRRVIMESLRMYPPSWIISRNVARDDEIAGYHIPKGEQVMISSYVVHRSRTSGRIRTASTRTGSLPRWRRR